MSVKDATQQPFFSIIIPTYNVAEYIDTCLQSIFAQTFISYEIIVADDCSTDSTIEKIQRYSDTKINLIRHTENMGPGAARNTAIKASSGTWLVCVDGDDWIAPHRLQELYMYIQNNEVDIVADNNFLVIDKNTIPQTTLFEKVGIEFFEKPISLSYLLTYTPAIHPIIRKEFLNNHNLTFIVQGSACEDYGLWVRSILCSARIHFIQKPLYFYRQRSDSFSSNKDRILQSLYVNTQVAILLAKDEVSKHLLEKKIREIEQKIAVRTTWKKFTSQKSFFTFLKLLHYIPFVIFFFGKKLLLKYT